VITLSLLTPPPSPKLPLTALFEIVQPLIVITSTLRTPPPSPSSPLTVLFVIEQPLAGWVGDVATSFCRT
jgi:hypothetical protein